MFERASAPRLSAAPDLPLAAPGEALRDYAVAELDSAIAGLRWRGARIHAGVHQARKALRRARATLALGRAALGPGAALVDREIRSVNHGLSALRDAQALVETLQRLIAKQPDAEVLRMLRRASRVAVARRAADARAALADEPALVARQDLLAALRGAMLALPWQRLALPQLWGGAGGKRRTHRPGAGASAPSGQRQPLASVAPPRTPAIATVARAQRCRSRTAGACAEGRQAPGQAIGRGAGPEPVARALRSRLVIRETRARAVAALCRH